MKRRDPEDVPYWFVCLVATANGTDQFAREAQAALRRLTTTRE